MYIYIYMYIYNSYVFARARLHTMHTHTLQIARLKLCVPSYLNVQGHIATVFLYHSHIHVWVREERAGSPPCCHLALADVDPKIIARAKEGSVRSSNTSLSVCVR